MSLESIIGALPDGSNVDLTEENVARWIRENYFTDAEADRMWRAVRRELLYQDAGDEYLRDYIDTVFSDEEVRRLRKQFVEVAKFNNAIKRLTNELSTVYQRPAKRSVGNATDATYQDVLRELQFDRIAREINRMMVRHEQLLIQVRVREKPNGDREPVIDLVHPGSFTPLADPQDPGSLIGFRVDQAFNVLSGTVPPRDQPAHIIWDDEFVRKLNADGHYIEGTKRAHGFDRMPLILVSMEKRSDRLISDTPRESWVAGHLSVWFEGCLALKESKSLNTQTIFIGDMTRMPVGQTADSETDMVGSDDVTTQTINRGVDLGQFQILADYVMERLATNEGIPPSVLRGEGATSGFEMELRRIAIREARRSQEIVLRAVEKELAQVMAMVFERDLPDRAFDPTGWRINFGEIDTPKTDKERLDVFEQERRLGVSNTLDFIKERDPDLQSDEEAADVLIHNIEVETERNRAMRPLQQISGSTGQPTVNEPAPPQEGTPDPGNDGTRNGQ